MRLRETDLMISMATILVISTKLRKKIFSKILKHNIARPDLSDFCEFLGSSALSAKKFR